jgi:hypothetical protein
MLDVQNEETISANALKVAANGITKWVARILKV